VKMGRWEGGMSERTQVGWLFPTRGRRSGSNEHQRHIYH